WMEVLSGSSLVISTWRTSPAVASMAASPVSETYPHVLASMPPISRERGRAGSVRRTVGSPSAGGVGVGRREGPGAEGAGPGWLVQAARAPVAASTSPPSRTCRREKLLVMVKPSLVQV